MASVSIKMPDDFLLKISKLEKNTDTIVPRVLLAGSKVVEKQVRANLKDSIGRDLKTKSQSTGQLLSSLGTSPALMDRNGDFNIKIGFKENRTDNKKNAMIASILEYGKQNQPPKPFLAPAKIKSKQECIRVMIETLDSEISKL